MTVANIKLYIAAHSSSATDIFMILPGSPVLTQALQHLHCVLDHFQCVRTASVQLEFQFGEEGKVVRAKSAKQG